MDKVLLFPELRGLIRAMYGCQANFAHTIGMEPGTLSRKLCGKTDWTRTEMVRACEALKLSLVEGMPYFFN